MSEQTIGEMRGLREIIVEACDRHLDNDTLLRINLRRKGPL